MSQKTKLQRHLWIKVNLLNFKVSIRKDKLIHDSAGKCRNKLQQAFNMQNKNPRGTPLHGRMRGSIRNLKAVEKIIHNRKKILSKPKNRMQNL